MIFRPQKYYVARARWLDSRLGVKTREESPGSIKTQCWLTASGGDLRESATENKPPYYYMVRVKRCGKSAPRFWQQKRHGKPHWEQDQIGAARSEFRLMMDAFLHQIARVGCLRYLVTNISDE